MKTILFTCYSCNSKYTVATTPSSCLQFVQPKKLKLSSGVCLFAALFCLILSALQLKAQITDTTVFPLNDYLYTTGSNPYPVVNNKKLQATDTSRFVNVMNFGAKGDGKTIDDDAIATAFNKAKYGVIFPSGKTFLVSKLSTINLTHDLDVYAYGATIKMADFSRYSFLSLEYKPGGYQGTVIWMGGKLNGNKKKQSWPGSPTGNNNWEEDHGRFVGVCNANFVLFKDVQLVNTVVDGIGIESCKLGVISDCDAKGGAPIQYSQVQEQGTYFKFTRAGLKTCYFLNLTCNGGSIGTHISYPENATMDTETISVHVNCHFYNQSQNAILIEDCYKNFFYNCTVGADTGYTYRPSVHLSNRTCIVSFKNCQFTNSRVNFNNASSLKLGIIDSCQFTSAFKSFNTPLSMFVEGRPTVCINTSFNGRTAAKYQAYLKNVRNCTFTNFDSLAIQGGYAVDSSTFITGNAPANLAKGGFVISSKFTNVKNTAYKNQPLNDDWKKVYLSYIDILSDKSTYLGRITCGGNTNASGRNSVVQDTAHNLQYASARVAAMPASSTALTNSAVKLYPNPTADAIHVTLNKEVAAKTALNIYDGQGRLVQTKTIHKNTAALTETIDVKNLSSGAYILEILNDHQKSSFNFIVAR